MRLSWGLPGNRPAGGMSAAAEGGPIGEPVITVVPVELADAALAAEVLDGLALVEDGLREAASAPSTTCSTRRRRT